jgi:hypothetical protein
MKIKDLCGLGEIPNDLKGQYGIEVEIEARDGQRLPGGVDSWYKEQDGSLRGNSVEYILCKPYDFRAAKLAVAHLRKTLQDSHVDVLDSFRTGVHIHINCLDKTVNQVCGILAAYSVIENLIVRWCGEDREGNYYCLRASDSTVIIRHYQDLYANGFVPSIDVAKYSAMNICPLNSLGTIEFRAMQTYPNLAHIEELLNILDTIVAFANNRSAKDVVKDILDRGPLAYARHIATKSGVKSLSDLLSTDEGVFKVRQSFATGLTFMNGILTTKVINTPPVYPKTNRQEINLVWHNEVWNNE